MFRGFEPIYHRSNKRAEVSIRSVSQNSQIHADVTDNKCRGDSYSNIAFDPNGALPSPSNPFGNTDDAARTPENVDLTTGPNWVNGEL